MSILKIHAMQAIIEGQVVELTKAPGGISEAQPSHLDCDRIIIHTRGNPAPTEFWQPAAKGVRYTITIATES